MTAHARRFSRSAAFPVLLLVVVAWSIARLTTDDASWGTLGTVAVVLVALEHAYERGRQKGRRQRGAA